MSGYIVVLFYLLDSLMSLLLPVSRGLFALIILMMLWSRADVRAARPTGWRLAAAFGALGMSGVAGAMLSGTPITPIFVFTVIVMYALWTTGARLPVRVALIRPDAALFGVVLAHLFLLISLAGFDVYERARGVESNRGAGLFLEPSHFALYMTPLWLMAFQRRRYRPVLIALLLLAMATVFSLTFALALAMAALVGALLRAPSVWHVISNMLKFAALLAVVATAVFTMGESLRVGEVSMASYLEERITGLFASADEAYVSLSSLAVLQGVEIASASLTASRGMGVGLGNLGINEGINNTSLYRELINRLTGDDTDLNLRDGGLLINKLTGEIGVWVLLLLPLLARHFTQLRQLGPGSVRGYHAALLAIVFTQLFVRGLPYFSATSCLAVLAMASFWHARPASAGAKALKPTGRHLRRRSTRPGSGEATTPRPLPPMGNAR